MLFLNGKNVVVNRFPNGESYIDLEPTLVTKGVNLVECKFQSDNDLLHLMLLTGHIKERGGKVSLLMRYFPYSRMDRAESNRLFSLKYLTKIISSLGFESVTVHEPHSDVLPALLDNVIVINKTYELTVSLLYSLIDDKLRTPSIYEKTVKQGIALVYPDAGASKRYSKQFNYPLVIECQKQRDFESGKIVKSQLIMPDNKVPKTAIIVDDLCSRGGTFLPLARQLKEAGVETVYLVVTHCEDNIHNGYILTTDAIDKIITTDSILSKQHDKIIVMQEG